ncbi:MAG: efflux RND transporter permease subunit [Bacteroidales bacterium]|nr:efflux RND transporter permease subunit [Bacteroidales bacterium]
MKKLVEYFIKYEVSGNVILFLLLTFGIVGMLSLQSTFFPKVPSRIIVIQAVYPGASPEEIEESIILKIEDKIKGITGIERVTSVSSENMGRITIETKRNANIDNVLVDVKNAVDQIISFPVGLENLDVFKVEVVSNAMSFAISGTDDLKMLKKVARKAERELLSYKNISKVTLSGFPREEIVINLQEERMLAHNITFQEVLLAVRNTNIEVTGGTVKGPQEEYKIRAKNRYYQGEDIKNIIVKAQTDGQVLRLKDVSTVEDTWEETPNRNFYNGEPSVNIDVSYTNDQDLIEITDFVSQYVIDFNEKHDHLQANITKDSSETVKQRIDLLTKNGIIGFVLVFILLALFLNYRLAFWVALSIPVSFAGMFILAKFFDITINVISLFGMITVIGILVDDGVVISENIYRHFENGKNRMQAAVHGTMEVLPAIFSAILTTIVAFSAFFFIDGRLGDFFKEMAFIVIATLIFSLVEGILILPAHIAHSKALDRKEKPNRFMRFTASLMNWMRNKLYRPLLDYSLRNRTLALAVPLAFLILTFGALKGGIIKSTFFPFIDREFIVINVKMPAGTPKEITLDKLNYIEEYIWQANDKIRESREDGLDVILAVDKRLGPTSTNEGVLNIKLLDNEARQMQTTDITAIISKKAGKIAGIEDLKYGGGSSFGMPIAISLQAENLDHVRAIVEELKLKLKELSDLKDISDNDPEGIREVNIKLKEKAYLLGLNVQNIIGQIRQGFFGGEIQRLQRGLDEVKVWVRYDKEGRSTISGLKNMYIRTNTGTQFLLKDLVSFEIKKGIVSINHTDNKREIKVEADIASADVSVSDMISSIEENIMPELLARFPEVNYSFEGQNREQQKSMGSMKIVMPVVILLMLSIIVLTFRSFKQTLFVLLLIPFSFIGVGWGHYIEGLSISLFSFLGLIALIGILVNDALVFVSTFNINIKSGIPFNKALHDAALSRFRPIVLTSITTIAGLAPLMLETSMQAQFLIPMAATIAYGLGVATIMILIVLPVLMSLSNSYSRFWAWFWRGEELSQEEVEPAYQEIKYDDEA